MAVVYKNIAEKPDEKQYRISFAGADSVYIHYRKTPAKKSSVLLPKPKTDRFKNIKSRYLNMLKSTISANSVSYNDIMQMSEVDFEKLMLEVQQGSADGFNTLAAQGNSLTDRLLTKVGELKPGPLNDKFISQLNEILAIIDQNKRGLGVLKAIEDSKTLPQFLSADLITLATRLRSQLAKYQNGENIPEGVIRDIRTQVSEWVTALGAYSVENEVEKINKTIITEFKKGVRAGNIRFTGVQGIESQLNSNRTIATKAADSVQTKHIKKDFKINGNNLSLDFEVDEAASTKLYTGNEAWAKLVSTSGINSLVMDALRNAGVLNSPANRTSAYHALAFSYKGGTEDILQKNYRIIRSHVIAEHGEKFLVGAAPAQAQALLVYNGRAYSVLEIISAIVEEAVKVSQNQENYGGTNSIFNVQITNVENKWVGKKREKDITCALQRSGNVRKAIEGIRAYGRLKIDYLKEILNNKGISSIKLT